MHRLLGRDRCDFATLGGQYLPEIFHVVIEPELYLQSTMDGGMEEIYLGNGAAEADDRERWHQMRGGTLCLAMSAEPDAAEHVCRLARALWRRGGTFVIEVTAQPKNHEPWKQLRAQVLGSLRKRRIVTNAGDSVRYKAASEKGNQAFDAAPEESLVDRRRRTREGGIRGPKAGLLLSRLEAPRASAMLLCEWSCLAAASRDAEDSVYNTKWVVHPWHEGLQHNEQVDQVCAERGRRALTFQEGTAQGLKVRHPQREEPCEYMKGSPQSSRPGKPCIPPARFWPYRGKTIWRMELGQRILDAVTPVIKEEQCGGFFLYGDVTWCNAAFSRTPRAAVGLSYGIEERDIWSELISQKMLPTKLYDCFIPPERSMPMAGKSPNGTRRCQGVEKQACYTTKYESYRICLGAEATVQGGRTFETLHSHLHGMPPLSVHLKIDTEGSEWPVLDALLASDDIHKLRTLDMEVHFGWTGSFPGQLSAKEQLALQVATMEKLLVYRQGWRPKDNCDDGTCNEPPVYLPGGFSMEMFAVSFVNRAMVK
eukprot:s9367_g2.t2